jgi:hypothetical protein
MNAQKRDVIAENKVFAWIAPGTAMVLSIPLVAMQFTDEVQWELADFVVMSILLFGMGSIFVYAARVLPHKYRLLVGLGFVLATLYIWAELAVGVFTNLGS